MNSLNPLEKYFSIYPEDKAPFMHRQFAEWQQSKPLTGLHVLHHVPIVQNTLLKIACLVAGGADVTVTNPSFMHPQQEAVAALAQCNIPYVENIQQLQGKSFDLYFDCGAELYQALGSPRLGSIELTASGDHYYQAQSLDFPVVSIDSTMTKQLETVFGTTEQTDLLISQLTGLSIFKQFWLIFGFGKIGHGQAYRCTKNHYPFAIADINPKARVAAEKLGIKAIDPNNQTSIQAILQETDIIITATGKAAVMNTYPKSWFQDKILVNLGVVDEFGDQFNQDEVLNNKIPINFLLQDPTPMMYIDPSFYAHNIGALEILKEKLPTKVNTLSKIKDIKIIDDWCAYHHIEKDEIMRWFAI